MLSKSLLRIQRSSTRTTGQPALSMRSRATLEDDRPQSLEAVLAPLSIEQFIAGPFGRAPIHLPGTGGRFTHLLDWEALEQLLEYTPLDAPQLALVKAGKTVPPETYARNLKGRKRLDGGAMSLLLDNGATAIINHVDDLVPAIASLVDDVGDRLHARSSANLYATWRTERGFDAHWDGHDVIVFQLAGRKEWPIYRPAVPDPVHNKVLEEMPAAAELECVYILEDGDVLYLPRGWIHAPAPLGEPSLHLTVSITRPTGADFVEWLATELESDPRVRASLPPSSDKPAFADWLEKVRSLIGDAVSAELAERFLIHRDAERAARPRFSFPDFGRMSQLKWTPATLLRTASRHRLPVEIFSDGSGQVTAAGRPWPCSRPVAAALLRLTSTQPLTLGSLMEGVDESEARRLRELLGLLAMIGLVDAMTAQCGDEHG